MTTRPDVVVVGAGIVGLATAFFLSRAGAKALVLEREAVGWAASGGAAGMVSPFAEVEGPPALDALAAAGLRLHRELAPILHEETGVDVRFDPLVVLRPAFDNAEASRLQARAARAAAGEQVRWLDGADARKLEPRLSPRALGALCATGEAQVDAYRVTLALAQAAERRGVEIRHGRVAGLLGDARRVSGVRLPHDTVAADRVVLAGGPWTGGMAPWAGMPIPVTPLRGQILHLDVPGPPLECCLMHQGGYVLRKGDGVTFAGTTEEAVGFRPRPTRRGRMEIAAAVVRLAPSLRDATLIRQTACLRPLSGDGLPLLGPVPGREGLYLATGHGRRGILLGLISGQIIAELLLHGRASLPSEAFAPGRFVAALAVAASGSPA